MRVFKAGWGCGWQREGRWAPGGGSADELFELRTVPFSIKAEEVELSFPTSGQTQCTPSHLLFLGLLWPVVSPHFQTYALPRLPSSNFHPGASPDGPSSGPCFVLKPSSNLPASSLVNHTHFPIHIWAEEAQVESSVQMSLLSSRHL